MSESEKNNIINKYKKIHKNIKNDNKFEDIANVNNISWSACNYIRNQKKFNININNNLKELLINKKNVMNRLKVNFERKKI